MEMMNTLATLLAEPVTAENAAARNAEIMKCHEQLTKIQEESMQKIPAWRKHKPGLSRRQSTWRRKPSI
jgi:hypothetical protein